MSHHPKIGMWGVYSEAMAWSVGDVHSDFNLGECIWRSCPKRSNLKLHFVFSLFGPLLQIRSPKLKSECPGPTFQAIASGQTPHMPILGLREIFTFYWVGSVLKSISHQQKFFETFFGLSIPQEYIKLHTKNDSRF